MVYFPLSNTVSKLEFLGSVVYTIFDFTFLSSLILLFFGNSPSLTKGQIICLYIVALINIHWGNNSEWQYLCSKYEIFVYKGQIFIITWCFNYREQMISQPDPMIVQVLFMFLFQGSRLVPIANNLHQCMIVKIGHALLWSY